jgi:Uma2 family endonuclease
METDDAQFEMVDGKRLKMPAMSIRAAMIASRLGTRLNTFAMPHRFGEAFVELLVRLPLGEESNRDRRPDVCFFSHAQLATEFFQNPEENALEMVPELAIEVTSPTDRSEDQREKVAEYFRAGVRSVWVVYPRLQQVEVYESPTSIRVLSSDDTLFGDPVLPGFQLPLADLFSRFESPKG